MINLPPGPFREAFVDDDDEFVKEAIKPRKSSDICWCGSKLEYGKCHAKRQFQKPIKLGKALNEQRKVFWKPRGCMHPEASADVCRGKIIDAHTIQRKGPLATVVDSSNHVFHIEIDHQKQLMDIKALGWKKASIFPGFCSHHDTELFRQLETETFKGTKIQCVLQSYRNVCCELYKKRALVDSLKYQRKVLDAGYDLHRQIEVQMSIHKNMEGQLKSIAELEELQNKFHEALVNGNLDCFETKVFPFSGEIEMVSAAVIQVDYDFEGNQFIDIFDLEQDAQSIIYSTMNTNCGGAIVFCWLTEHECAKKFVDSFESIEDCDKGDIFAQYCFLSSEHTFFSKTWWDSLSDNQRDRIFKLYRCTYYEGGKFTVGNEPIVQWQFFNSTHIGT